MKEQLELLKKSISLSEAHPELDIMFCTISYFLPDEFSWAAQQIERVYIDYVYKDEDGNFYIGMGEIKECLDDRHGMDFTKDEILEKINHKQMIIVETVPKIRNEND